MEESNTKICSNCNRDIPKDNYEIHTVHCVRNIRNCAVCTEPVPITLMQEHIERMHSMLNCPSCDEEVRGADMEDHIRDSCSLTPQTCRYCSLDMARLELPRHEDYCGSRTEECPDCKKYVMLKYRGIHLDSNHSFVKLPDEEDPRPPSHPILSSTPRFMFQRSSFYCSPQQLARLQQCMRESLLPEDLRFAGRRWLPPLQDDIASNDTEPVNVVEGRRWLPPLQDDIASNDTEPVNVVEGRRWLPVLQDDIASNDTEPVNVVEGRRWLPVLQDDIASNDTEPVNVVEGRRWLPVLQDDIASNDTEPVNDEPEPSTSGLSARSLRRPLEGVEPGPSSTESVNTSPVPRKVTKRTPKSHSSVAKECASNGHKKQKGDGKSSKKEEEEEKPPTAPPEEPATAQDLVQVRPERPPENFSRALLNSLMRGGPFPPANDAGTGPTLRLGRQMSLDEEEEAEALMLRSINHMTRGLLNYTPMTSNDFMQRFRLLQLRPDGPEDNNNEGLSASNPELSQEDRFGNIRRELSALRRNLNQVTTQASTLTAQPTSSSQSAPVTPAVEEVYIPCEICQYPCNSVNLAMHQSLCSGGGGTSDDPNLTLKVDLDEVDEDEEHEENGILLPCEFCDLLFGIDTLEGHQQSCRNTHPSN